LVDAAFAASIQGSKFNPMWLWGQLDKMEAQITSTNEYHLAEFLAGTLPLVASVGFIIWNLWSPYLLGSAVAGVPLWKRGVQGFDPLTILEHWEKESQKGPETETLQSLIA
jgi:hypothetical protein